MFPNAPKGTSHNNGIKNHDSSTTSEPPSITTMTTTSTGTPTTLGTTTTPVAEDKNQNCGYWLIPTSSKRTRRTSKTASSRVGSVFSFLARPISAFVRIAVFLHCERIMLSRQKEICANTERRIADLGENNGHDPREVRMTGMSTGFAGCPC